MIDQQAIVNMIFGFKAKYLRQQHGFSLEELAKRSGLSKSYLHEIEKGKKYPKVNKIQAMAEALGVDYDFMVSTRASKKLQPIVDLLTSDFVKEFPLELFGISPEKLFELFSNTPDKVNAFISTLFKLTRNYQMQREQLYMAALRSYQDMYDNYFPDLEAAVRDFREQTGWDGLGNRSPETLAGLLSSRYGLRVDKEAMPKLAELRGQRAYFQPETRTLYLNAGLSSAQQRFLLCRELAFQHLALEERPYFTRIVRIDSFERLLNNFKASYFAVALLMEEEHMLADIRHFAEQPQWSAAAITGLLDKYDVTPEMLLQRWTNLLPQHFGIKDLFFIRIAGSEGLQHFRMTKELHLSQLHQPYANELNEHYCRRWVSVNIIKKLKTKVAAKGSPPLLIEAQISAYWQTPSQYFCLSIAKPDFDAPGRGVSVTIGLLLNEELRRHFRFIGQADLPVRLVHTTCERCGIDHCEARAVAPIVLEQERQREVVLKAAQLLRH